MPAIKQTTMQAENPATPTKPVTHRAILKPRGPADEIRSAALPVPASAPKPQTKEETRHG
jgi:hypothetical protein